MKEKLNDGFIAILFVPTLIIAIIIGALTYCILRPINKKYTVKYLWDNENISEKIVGAAVIISLLGIFALAALAGPKY